MVCKCKMSLREIFSMLCGVLSFLDFSFSSYFYSSDRVLKLFSWSIKKTSFENYTELYLTNWTKEKKKLNKSVNCLQLIPADVLTVTFRYLHYTFTVKKEEKTSSLGIFERLVCDSLSIMVTVIKWNTKRELFPEVLFPV